MAPTRRNTTTQRGARALAPPENSLSFGGTERLQDNDFESASQDQSYQYDSDADEDEEFAEDQRKAKKKSAQKGARRQSGKTTTVKCTESDYGSDNKRIIELKTAGYKEDYISNKLTEEGRRMLTAKTVNTRWLRLKKIVDRKEEERMDDELSDWHVGEDEKLRDRFNTADTKYEIELLKLKERKWNEIAAGIQEDLGVKKYTPKACKERWESLQDGSALIPIELDGNPNARAAIRAARIQENKRRRQEQKEAKLWALGAKDREAAAKRAILEVKEQERQAERARKQAERDEDDRIKAEQRAGLEEKRARQRAIEAMIRKDLEDKREERKNADAMYMHYTGKKLNGRKDDNLIKAAGEEDSDSDSDIEMMEDYDYYDDDEELDMPHLTDAEESAAERSEPDGERNSARPPKSRKSKHGIKSNKTKVTLETLVNPRSIMSDAELGELLVKRSLRRRARDESHAELVARIAAADVATPHGEIKDLLAQYFDRRKGTKDLHVRRLQEYDAASSDLGLQGVTATDPEFKASYSGYSGKFAYAREG